MADFSAGCRLYRQMIQRTPGKKKDMAAVRKLFSCVIVVAWLASYIVPATAQFEISPDHFQDRPDVSPKQTRRAAAQRQEQDLMLAQRELNTCENLLADQDAAVEQAREMAAGAGAMGDAAAPFTDSYITEVEKRQALVRQLAQRIARAKAFIEGTQPAVVMAAKAAGNR
jgi:hypothetical protein